MMKTPSTLWFVMRLLGVALVLAAPAVNAEPYLAVRMGLKCGACHENPTGGGLRTTMGNVFAQTQMAARTVDFGELGPWTGALNRFVSLGGDARAAATSTRVSGQPTTNEFEVQELRAYLQVNPLPERLSVVVDQRLAPGTSNNLEAYARLWFDRHRVYVKAGQFYLPYGLRLEDDGAFIRQVPGINMTTPDTGAEVGYESGPWSAQFAVSNGTAGAPEDDQGKQYSLKAEHVRSAWRLGASANFNDSDSGERVLVGAHAGLRTGPIAWLAEIDRVTDDGFPGGRRVLWASLIEANWAPRRGHNLKLTFEGFDPDDDVSEDEQNRVSLLWEYAPLPFVQLRVGARVYDGIPQNDLQNRKLLIAELHAFF